MRKKIFLLIISLLVLSVGTALAGEKNKGIGKKIRLGKERLVARDVGEGSLWHSKWCGNNALIFSGSNVGMRRIDLTTGEQVQIRDKLAIEDQSESPLDCTPDGKWPVYMKLHNDFVPLRKGEHRPKDTSLWVRDTYSDLFFYDVATGKRYKFAKALDIGSALEPISPDGSKIYLGLGYSYDPNTPGPKFKPVWFSDKRLGAGSGTFWFDDSSGMLTLVVYPLDFR